MTVPVQNFKTAAAFGLRSLLKCKVSNAAFSVPVYTASGDGHYGTTFFIIDTLLQARGWPNIFTASYLRSIVDTVIAVSAAHPSPYSVYCVPGDIPTTGIPTYTETIYGGTDEAEPMLDTPGTLALLLALCYDRGNTSVYGATTPVLGGTYAARVKAALDMLPRDGSGAICQPDWHHRIPWCKEDGTLYGPGAVAIATVWNAWGYSELGRIATLQGDSAMASACASAKAALAAGLVQLRYTSGPYAGLYAASTNTTSNGGQDPTNGDHKPHIQATSLAALLGLCSGGEVATASALVSQYQAGTISNNGCGKWLLDPFVWNLWKAPSSASALNAVYGRGANMGAFAEWPATAMALAPGGDVYAAAMLNAENQEILRQERASGNAPWEFLPYNPAKAPSSGNSASFYGDTSAHVAAVDVAPTIAPVTLTAANGWQAIIDLNAVGHRVSGMVISCGSAGTYTVQVRGIARTDAEQVYAPGTISYASENTTPIVTASLSSESSKTVTDSTPDLSCRGGKLRVFVSSGTPPGDVTVTLQQADLTVSLASMAAGAAPPIPPGYVVEVNGVPKVLGQSYTTQSAGQTVRVYDYTGATVASATVPGGGNVLGLTYAPASFEGDTSSSASFGGSQNAVQTDVGALSAAATAGASQDASLGAPNRLTVSASPVVDGRVTLSGYRIRGSVVYVSY